MGMQGQNLLKIEDLYVQYETDNSLVYAVNGLNLEVNMGETVGLVGETGAGKTSTALSIMKLLPDKIGKISRGKISLNGVDITAATETQMQAFRGETVSMIFQDPMTSLNPVIKVGKQIEEVLLVHRPNMSKQEREKRVDEMLEMIGISPERKNEYPHQFSGGMKQRIVIAIALACKPQLLICDEPTTALDVTVQAKILELIQDIQKRTGIAVIYITHDLGVVAKIADFVNVMYAGKIVECGTVDDIFYEPRHPYTWGLLSSMPDLDTADEKLYTIPGSPPNLLHPVKGDAFAPRNEYAMAIDFEEEPPMFTINSHHKAATWLLHPQAPKVEMPAQLRRRIDAMLKGGQ